LLDPEFPEKFARYARTVAGRYPWVRDYTPVNEPLTTARFSALYGHWFPHRRNDRDFCRALLNQCKAVVLAMREIRRENPRARLVQSEDMGFTRSTAPLAEQAAFENERRFLSYDLLCGGVDREHPLYSYLRRAGVGDAELAWFSEHATVPDVAGINYYVTSERFLDHRLERYPARLIGGNGVDRYADVEAVRVVKEGLVGPARLLRTTSERLGTRVAITEAHLGCDAGERSRWLSYVVREAWEARRLGIDVAAVTAWSLLGSHGWTRLVTEGLGSYEPGVFHLRNGIPEPTEVAHALASLCRGEPPPSRRRSGDGWWEHDERLEYPPHSAEEQAA
jgi:dTDP-4-dehydrorhamnose reductase